MLTFEEEGSDIPPVALVYHIKLLPVAVKSATVIFEQKDKLAAVGAGVTCTEIATAVLNELSHPLIVCEA